jgi:Tol biopolymer transport system component
VWTGDGRNLIVSAVAERGGGNQQLWLINHPGGEVRRITNDLTRYGSTTLGVTRDSSTLITLQGQTRQRLWMTPIVTASGGNSAPVQISQNEEDGIGGFAFTHDNRVVFITRTNGRPDIWIMNADGQNRRQLTNDDANESGVVVSPDNRYIVFNSDRSGLNIWRMDIDGGNARRLTDFESGNPVITPDGQTVLFAGWRGGRPFIFRISIEGGEAEQVTDRRITGWWYSPDGTRILCSYFDDSTTPGRWRPGVMSSDLSQPPTPIELPSTAVIADWLDDRTILYTDRREGADILFTRPLEGGTPPRQIAVIASPPELLFGLRLASDRRRLLVARGTSPSDVILIRDFR